MNARLPISHWARSALLCLLAALLTGALMASLNNESIQATPAQANVPAA